MVGTRQKGRLDPANTKAPMGGKDTLKRKACVLVGHQDEEIPFFGIVH